MLLFETFIPNNFNAFVEKVKSISDKLGINPDWLMTVMYAESRLKPNAYNPNGGASGLIQFMPSTAIGLGTTTTALRNMTNVQQLDYVYKYFKSYVGRIHSVYDLYLITFFPVALGQADTWVIHSSKLSAETIAKANPIIDLNKNKQITVGEFKQYVDGYLKKKVS